MMERHLRDLFLNLVCTKDNLLIMQMSKDMGIPDCWLTGGAIFQRVWNHKWHLSRGFGISDYDLFYFDPDTSPQAEDNTIRAVQYNSSNFNLDGPLQIRNQSRIHLWRPSKYGGTCPEFKSAKEAINGFMFNEIIVACRLGHDNEVEVYAPNGLQGMFDGTLTPNPSSGFSVSAYEAKKAKWKNKWPGLEFKVFEYGQKLEG